MRIVVTRWDDDYIYGTADDPDGRVAVKVCYTHGNPVYHEDWSYLRSILQRDAQLNLVRPRAVDDALCPELIIFEPDYLVDITTVARCFTHYAESPFVNLLKKIEPAQTTASIVLGNFAGQLLDEQIHRLPESHSYAESVSKFWRHNAVGLLTVDVGNTFHEEAQNQQRNIAKAIDVVLPSNIDSFNCRDCIVEPSFFSEMLGLQGRMDFLQMDYKILLEQKSGKGEYPTNGFITPLQKEEHYVQMLLYMLLIRYNFREVYEANHEELHTFLLYSKYQESLLGLGFSPDLIYRAIKVRNTLARTELMYAHEEGFRILEGLTPEKLNRKGVGGKLWEQYERPQLARLLQPIARASELEKAYYFRFLTFIANEHLLAKLGNKTKESSGFAAKWYNSLQDKLQAGNIYHNLTLISPNETTEGNVKNVQLKFAEDDNNNMSNFRVGDIVILYAYDKDKEPDVRKSMVFRSTIAHIGLDDIELVLRATQSDSRVFLRGKDKLWAIEHDFLDSSFSSLYRAMHAFLSAPKQRRDLLLLQREPLTDPSVMLNGDYGAFNELVLAGKRARDLFLIIGPPGTGKTSYGLLNALREELTDPSSTVLMLSYTNRAVDEICSKLEQSGIDYVRLGGDLTCSAESKGRLLNTLAKGCRSVAELKGVVTRTRVLVATTTAMNANIALFQLKQFSLAIVDEASQILEPHLLGILSAHIDGKPAVARFILIGDHKQLPAVVQQPAEVSAVHEAALNDIGLTDCRLSLFERLLWHYRHDPSVVYMLTKQGRMHHDIALFPNTAFYNDRLDVVPLAHQLQVLPRRGGCTHGIDNLLTTRRLAFLHAELPKASTSDKVNHVEAEMIAATVVRIYHLTQEDFNADRTVGVIVPYRNQIATVRNTIDRWGISVLHDITIDTVERYQGSQRKYIIYGFTIQKAYQLDFLTDNVFEEDGCVIDRKLNVAMTRAEEHLLLVGNAPLLAANPTFGRLIDFAKQQQGYFEVPLESYVTGDFVVPDLDAEGDKSTI
jgi:hypothetical protein